MTEQMKDKLLYYMYGHSFFVQIIVRALQWQSQRQTPFRWYDIRAIQRDLDKLVLDGVLTKVDGKGYVLTDGRATLAAYQEYVAAVKKAKTTVAGQPPKPPPGVPKDLFEDIVGYDDLKRQCYMAMGARSPVHVIFIGPSSTAKSLFLEALATLPGAEFSFGDAISKAGLRRFIKDNHPEYLIIDEIDKMAIEDASILLEVMEHQTVSVMHYDQSNMEDIAVRVFAAANRIEKMKPELLSRFFKLYLKEYTREEFIQVANKYLLKKGTPGNIAKVIADGVANRTRDIRDARRISDMCSTVDDAMFLIDKLNRAAQV